MYYVLVSPSLILSAGDYSNFAASGGMVNQNAACVRMFKQSDTVYGQWEAVDCRREQQFVCQTCAWIIVFYINASIISVVDRVSSSFMLVRRPHSCVNTYQKTWNLYWYLFTSDKYCLNTRNKCTYIYVW